MPLLVEWHILKTGGSLWLPNVTHTAEMIEECAHALGKAFVWELVEDPNLNPLYSATEKVNNELLIASPKAILTNDTQLPYLLAKPFYKFIACKMVKTPTSTHTTSSSKKKKTMASPPPQEMRSIKRKLSLSR
jgi:hypothetical protein